MADFSAVAKDVFQTMRQFAYPVKLYDENDMAVIEPQDARRMVAFPKNIMVSLLDDDDNSRITLSMGKSVHINDVMGLNQRLRALATKYNLMFRCQQYGKTISPKNFAEMVSVTEGYRMQVCEGMYGTSRSSYLRLENARMIVRHNQRIDDSKPGARGRCVESVFVENKAGERALLPTGNLMAGRAMTQHVNQGGGFADPVAQQINAMAVDYGNLGVGAHAAVSESAMPVREACRSKMRKMRECFGRLSKPSSYAAEAAALEAQGKLLNETTTPITDSRIDELRQLLNGDLAKEVYECCCKAMDEHAEPGDEKLAPNPAVEHKGMVHVLGGHPVSSQAWDDFREHHIDLKEPVQFSSFAGRASATQVANSLHSIAALARDESMANLLDFVADELVTPSMPEAGKTPRWQQQQDMRRKYKIIAINALQAVGIIPLGPGLATKNESVVEHLAWLGQFEPDRILTEAGPMDPYSPLHDTYDNAESSVVGDFDPQAFVESPEMQDILGGRDPHDPEENQLDTSEIMSALDLYLQHAVESRFDQFADTGYDGSLAAAVYEKAADALRQRGYVIADTGLMETGDLTIEDVLLPKKDAAASLSGEVTKADVVDPVEPDKHGPADSSYTSRLMTLAGMRRSDAGM